MAGLRLLAGLRLRLRRGLLLRLGLRLGDRAGERLRLGERAGERLRLGERAGERERLRAGERPLQRQRAKTSSEARTDNRRITPFAPNCTVAQAREALPEVPAMIVHGGRWHNEGAMDAASAAAAAAAPCQAPAPLWSPAQEIPQAKARTTGQGKVQCPPAARA